MSSDRLLNAYVKFNNRTNPKRYTEPLSLSLTHSRTHAHTHTCISLRLILLQIVFVAFSRYVPDERRFPDLVFSCILCRITKTDAESTHRTDSFYGLATTITTRGWNFFLHTSIRIHYLWWHTLYYIYYCLKYPFSLVSV